jgi:hypothetical protein
MNYEFEHPVSFFRKYDSPLVDEYEKALDGVIRFNNPNMPPIDPEFQENDRTHTYSCIERFQIFLTSCPQNKEYLKHDIQDIAHMLYLHEAGEPIAGDTPLSMTNFLDIQSRSARLVNSKLKHNGNGYHSQEEIRELMAQMEHKFFRKFGLPKVKPEHRAEVERLYFRFEEPNPTDPSAKLAKVFDILDGNHTALRAYQNINPAMGKISRIEYNERTEADGMRLAKTVVQYARLISPDAAEEAIKYFTNEAQIFKNHGYPHVYNMMAREMKTVILIPSPVGWRWNTKRKI